MNKKFLSAVLFGALIAGSSVTFTGCIDNDEPAGIENLRGAKAELLRAKVAVEEANAAAKNADAALTLAKAETEKANAEQVKAQTELIRLQAEFQATQNETEKARLEAEIAQLKETMEENALKHQAEMLKLQEGLAVAKRQYEVALKQIEIAQALMSESDKVTLAELKQAVVDAQGEVDGKAEEVKTAEKKYYEAVLQSRVDSVNFKRLELDVTKAKANQVVAEETLAKWSDFLKKDTETADWRKEVTVLEDSIEGLKKKQSELQVELAKRQNSEEYKKLIDAKNQTAAAYSNLKTQEKLEYKDMMGEVNTVGENTPINDALVLIGGPKKDGKGGYVARYNAKIADYTSQKKALLDELAANQEVVVKNAKDASDKYIAKWKDATAAYATAKAYTTEEADKKAVEKALETYNEAITAAAGDAKKELKAQQTFADAIVKYYNAAAPVQLTTNKVSLQLTVGTKTTWISKTVKEWLSDSDNKDVYLVELIKYFGSAEKLWEKGQAEKFDADTESITTKATAALATLKTVGDILGELQSASNDAFGEASLYGKGLADQENGYMRVQPTETEIKAVENYNSKCGALGHYYYVTRPEAEFEAKNYKAIIADYEKALKYWNDQLTALKKTQATAKAAMEAAQNALDAYEEDNFEALEMEIYGEIGGRLRALEAIKSALVSAINTWLPENGDYQGTEKFETWLKEKVEKAEYAVIDAEEAVAIAEKALIEAKDGKYDELTAAKEALDKAMAKLEKAQAELAEATANLQKGVEIMSKTADAE